MLNKNAQLWVDDPQKNNKEIRYLLKILGNIDVVPEDFLIDFKHLKYLVIKAPKEILQPRYERELKKLNEEVKRLEQKLSNEKFLNNAPPDIVAKEWEKLTDYETERFETIRKLNNLEFDTVLELKP